MTKFAPYAKALIGAIVAALAVLLNSLDGPGSVTTRDYVSAVLAGLVALGAVFVTPNTPAPPPKP